MFMGKKDMQWPAPRVSPSSIWPLQGVKAAPTLCLPVVLQALGAPAHREHQLVPAKKRAEGNNSIILLGQLGSRDLWVRGWTHLRIAAGLTEKKPITLECSPPLTQGGRIV